MQIKTITCHEVYNYGASLQEHALLKYLQDLGHNTQAIHYKPSYLSGHHKLWVVSNPRFEKNIILKYSYLLAKLPGRLLALKRKKAFDLFSLKYIQTDNTLYKTNNDLKNNLPKADVYICGSDQIWNSFFQNGKDPAFYLDFVPDNKLKISYAASFATETIANELKPFVKEQVSKIDFVSVRETSGLNILEGLEITNAIQVLDPVFLLDNDYWKKEFVLPIQEKFIFIYDFDSNENIKKIATDIAKKNNYKIYTINKNISYADKNLWLKGPKTFLSLIANAELILSNSFHAVAFSIIFNKQFYVFNRNEKINTRMRDLLNLVNLSYLLIDNKTIEVSTTQPIQNYLAVNSKVNIAIKSSKDFLINSLK